MDTAIIEHADLFTALVVEFHDTDMCAELFNEQMAALSSMPSARGY